MLVFAKFKRIKNKFLIYIDNKKSIFANYKDYDCNLTFSLFFFFTRFMVSLTAFRGIEQQNRFAILIV